MSENESFIGRMPQFPESYWLTSEDIPAFPALAEDLRTDTVVIGGGITGLTTAYLLARAGKKVVVLEADRVINGTTGHTTAKITAQHDIIYAKLLGQLGSEQARLYYEANLNASRFIENLVRQERIPCDYKKETAYIYATTDEEVRQIEEELEAYRKLSIPGEHLERLPLPLPVHAALSMENQAQFHPVRYLCHLIEGILREGGQIFESTTAADIIGREERKPEVVTKAGFRVVSSDVVIASHFPFYDKQGLYFSRLHAERSYVLAVKTGQAYPGGMYLSAGQPKRSLRQTEMNGESLVLIGGESHKTGQGVCTIKHYEALEAFGDGLLGIREIPFRWSAQDLNTLDNIPYVGPLTSDHPNIFVATGYGKWGMTNGTAAALLISDLIQGKDNPYTELYSPSRFHANPGIKNFIMQNADVAGHFIAGKVDFARKRTEELANDEGAVVTIDGKRAGAYRDLDGELHLIDTTCTHMGCELEWNDGERSWDCPCHGSRFSTDGEVIEGPAVEPLQRLDAGHSAGTV